MGRFALHLSVIVKPIVVIMGDREPRRAGTRKRLPRVGPAEWSRQVWEIVIR